MENDIQDIKTRIFNAAVHLFAQRSYGLVGVREIAQEAEVSISMISYHYGGKAGIMEAILTRFFEHFKEMFTAAIREDQSFEDNIRGFFAGLVGLIRREPDLSMVWFTGLSTTIPEVNELKRYHQELMAADANALLGKIGLDLQRDIETVSILSGAFIHMVFSHFVSSPILEREDQVTHYDDAFYDRYIEIMTQLCLNGIKNLYPVIS